MHYLHSHSIWFPWSWFEAISLSIKIYTVTRYQGGANPTSGELKRFYLCVATQVLSDVLLLEYINISS